MATTTTSTLSLAEQYATVVERLEALETEERLRHHSTMQQRAPPLEYDDVLMEQQKEQEQLVSDDNAKHAGTVTSTKLSFRKRQLKTLPADFLQQSATPRSHSSQTMDWCKIVTLDLANNELMDLPSSLSQLTNLQELILSRNWFNTLPDVVGTLSLLQVLDLSRNFFRPNEASLKFTTVLQQLSHLHTLDLTYNQKCGTPQHRDTMLQQLSPLLWQETDASAKVAATTTSNNNRDDQQHHDRPKRGLLVTLWEKISTVPGAYVGTSAADRDATLLRSQLEPWGTVALRRRLVCDFGQSPTNPATVGRADVMEQLLQAYTKEGYCNAVTGKSNRKVVYTQGIPVRKDLLDELLLELRDWRGNMQRGGSPAHRERPSIQASCYMILRAPDANDRKLDGQVPPSTKHSRRAARTQKKLDRNRRLWDLAHQAIQEVDPVFAQRCTELAVTSGFTGSPHIDKQNCGPFYGLALGNFTQGTGGICVEASARVIVQVNTKNRLGRVDGRYPHWVAPYDAQKEERFSLIYYETGGNFTAPGPAVFDLPALYPLFAQTSNFN